MSMSAITSISDRCPSTMPWASVRDVLVAGAVAHDERQLDCLLVMDHHVTGEVGVRRVTAGDELPGG